MRVGGTGGEGGEGGACFCVMRGGGGEWVGKAAVLVGDRILEKVGL